MLSAMRTLLRKKGVSKANSPEREREREREGGVIHTCDLVLHTFMIF